MVSQIIHADTIDYLQTVPAGIVDVIITSPRYNFGKNYGPDVSDKTSMSDYFSEMSALGAVLSRVAKEDAILFLNVGTRAANPLHDFEVVQQFCDSSWQVQERVIWQKASSDEGVGHFTPINSPCYLNNLWETIFILSKDGRAPLDRLAVGVPFKDETNIKRWKHGRTVHCRGDVWFIPHETIQNRAKDRDGHEATFPRELVVRCLRLAERGRTGLRVLDPCCGTGTVPCTALEQGHHGLGIEMSTEMAASAGRNLTATMERMDRP